LGYSNADEKKALQKGKTQMLRYLLAALVGANIYAYWNLSLLPTTPPAIIPLQEQSHPPQESDLPKKPDFQISNEFVCYEDHIFRFTTTSKRTIIDLSS
jgi:hypothetical protein